MKDTQRGWNTAEQLEGDPIIQAEAGSVHIGLHNLCAPQATEKGDALNEAGQTLDKPLGGSEACQSRGASGSLQWEELVLPEHE